MEKKITKDSNGYLRESDNRQRSGYIHVQTAEKKLSRKLGKKEVVHHNDEDKTNNSPENITVFRNDSYHKLAHSKIPHERFQTKDGSFVAIKEQYKCVHCSGMFEPNKHDDIYCDIKCYLADKAKRIPTAEDLRDLVWKTPTTNIAQAFGVSDKAVQNWCEKYNIEKPPRGYWTKKAFGKL